MILERERLLQDVESSSSDDGFRLSISEDFKDAKPLPDPKSRRWLRPRFYERKFRSLIIILVLLVILVLLFFHFLKEERRWTSTLSGEHASYQQEMKKPDKIPIVAVVFCTFIYRIAMLFELTGDRKMAGDNL